MKKHIGKILLLLLAAVLAVTLAACDDGTSGTGGGGNPGDDPSPATLSVTFDANGGLDNEGIYDVEVSYGSTVATPKRADGTVYIPTRLGYTFDYWQMASGDEFVFSDSDEGTPTVVTSDTELSAHWTANTYTHTLVTENDDNWSYDGTVTLEEGASFETVYDSDEPAGDIPVPTVTSNDGTEDWFVYWYYIDADGNEVPFTTWSDKDGTEPELLDDYTIIPESGATGLTLYPKLHSRLPDYTVTFDGKGAEGDTAAVNAKLNDTLTAPTEPSRDGFVFGGWYYTVTKGEGDDAVTTEHLFVFFEETDDGDNSDDATVLSESIGTEGEGGSYSITLYAKWQRSFTLTADNAADLASAVADALAGDDEAAKEEWQNAVINVTENITLTLTDWTPLFTEEYPFTGTLTGGGATVTLTYDAAYTGSVYAFLGANAGTVSNLNVTVNVSAFGTSDSDSLLVGAVGVNSGTLNACTFTVNIGSADAKAAAQGKTVYIGGAAARTATGSEILTCTSSVAAYVDGAGSIYAGGVFGFSANSSTTSAVESTEVTSFVLDATAANTAVAGGFGGQANSVNVSESGVISAEISVSADKVYAGGFAGTTSRGNFSECYADSSVTAEGDEVYAGGFTGNNRSLVNNCRAGSDIAVTVRESGSAYVGGIAGASTRQSSSASHSSAATGDINSSYGAGSITVTAQGDGATVYAGGVAGRMSTMRSYRSFTSVAITVTNNGTNHVGAHTGRTVNTVTFEKCYYANDVAVTLNGTAIDLTAPSGVTGTESADYTDETWLNGEDNFDLDRGVWKVVENEDGTKEIRLVTELPEEDGGEEETPAEEA